MRFDAVRRRADALGIAISPLLLSQADEVIG
jgi:hypothetical protein